MSLIPEQVQRFFVSRKVAYQRVFNEDSHDVRQVLKDLAKFCRANETAFHKDPRAHAVLEGRREVYLRIQNYLKLTPDQLWEIYRKD